MFDALVFMVTVIGYLPACACQRVLRMREWCQCTIQSVECVPTEAQLISIRNLEEEK